MKLLKKIFDFFASFGFAVVLLLFLLLLTFLGTLDQVENGLYYTQQKYFNSLYVVHEFFDVVPVLLPGTYLLLGLFLVNIICGGIIRIRKNWKKPGIIIAHIGIITLLVGAFVTFHYSDSGNMRLAEGQSSNEFVSYYDWVIEIGRPEETDELLIVDDDNFIGLDPGESRTFYSDDLPFDVTLSGFAKNCMPVQVGPGTASRVSEVDGYYLETLPLENEAEQNIAGAYITVTDHETGEAQRGILWGFQMEPLTIEHKDTKWTFELTRKRWEVPFTLALNTFVRELYPGTDTPKAYESYVTKFEGDSTENIKIYMNHPLRHRGYTFFQASFGSDPSGAGEFFSVFSVVRNPADQVPLVATIIIGVGLLIHFTQKLFRYLQIESKRRTA